MANDNDLLNDIEDAENEGNTQEAKLLMECWKWRYNNYDEAKAEKAKNAFEDKFGYWDNYY